MENISSVDVGKRVTFVSSLDKEKKKRDAVVLCTELQSQPDPDVIEVSQHVAEQGAVAEQPQPNKIEVPQHVPKQQKPKGKRIPRPCPILCYIKHRHTTSKVF